LKFGVTRETPSDLADQVVVRGARGLAFRLSRLADAFAEPSGERGRDAVVEGSRELPRQRPHLRRSSCLARSACGRRLVRSASGRAVDAGSSSSGSSASSWASCRQRRAEGRHHRAEPARSPVRGRGSEQEVGGRLHLHLDGGGLALRRGGDRRSAGKRSTGSFSCPPRSPDESSAGR